MPNINRSTSPCPSKPGIAPSEDERQSSVLPLWVPIQQPSPRIWSQTNQLTSFQPTFVVLSLSGVTTLQREVLRLT
ncbi:hypothetical protein VTK26DRAFT_2247 [Humicola hyalothermophila]